MFYIWPWWWWIFYMMLLSFESKGILNDCYCFCVFILILSKRCSPLHICVVLHAETQRVPWLAGNTYNAHTKRCNLYILISPQLSTKYKYSHSYLYVFPDCQSVGSELNCWPSVALLKHALFLKEGGAFDALLKWIQFLLSWEYVCLLYAKDYFAVKANSLWMLIYT